jgi:hypothetical protein
MAEEESAATLQNKIKEDVHRKIPTIRPNVRRVTKRKIKTPIITYAMPCVEEPQ